MKAIMVMFDTLNRRMLSPYGAPDWIHTPNFKRLAERTAVFDNSYIGSMPCMPARRELHTGRHNFLHRSWGPLEPFDDSAIELLGDAGVYTHLVTDHQHYWEDGGGTYHPRYRSFELIRGQEGDPWKGEVNDEGLPEELGQLHPYAHKLGRQDRINRKYIREEKEFPQARTFSKGLEFIRKNADEDRWFLQLETFDPHEPFYSPELYKNLYPHRYEGRAFDWPTYGPVTETKEEVEHLRYEYLALLSMCDHYLGRVFDTMDELGLWDDTMLIVNTDHGFLLGEHDQWAKCVQPFYNEVAHTPLFIWDPRSRVQGVNRRSLVQTVDLPATLLDFFGLPLPKDMQGKPLSETIASDKSVREAALFGLHGGHVNVTDGRYVYMRAAASPDNRPLYDYTLMPTHMRSRFRPEELRDAELSEPFSFTKGTKLLRIPASTYGHLHQYGTLLFDLEQDPEQRHPIQDPAIEARMIDLLKKLMAANDAPPEQYVRIGLAE
ncbi:sulfatase [Cohnella thailandensis]|uniref:Sulfatase n=1 Tax=Cohnella thailandensis TaxID=557557 RepID=A0A841SXK3_9BACL|nr:sulfatase [Cohnella thailandensis]MBB6634915.1 sulfatase [Cohnella thailandensis]MBP1975863.1 arylsulfatase A-like enzyme [Cohnella thailandensis]